jgi:hypothetical protein
MNTCEFVCNSEGRMSLTSVVLEQLRQKRHRVRASPVRMRTVGPRVYSRYGRFQHLPASAQIVLHFQMSEEFIRKEKQRARSLHMLVIYGVGVFTGLPEPRNKRGGDVQWTLNPTASGKAEKIGRLLAIPDSDKGGRGFCQGQWSDFCTEPARIL